MKYNHSSGKTQVSAAKNGNMAKFMFAGSKRKRKKVVRGK